MPSPNATKTPQHTYSQTHRSPQHTGRVISFHATSASMSLLPRQIVTRFNRAATTYDDVAQLQRSMADELIAQFLKSGSCPHEGPIADLGCGTGYLLQALQSQGYVELAGYDMAPAMLTAASERLGDNAIALREADLQSLPVADEHFDVVFSNAAIQWCDANSAAAEMKRVLRPGGQVFVSTFGPQTLCQWRDAFAAHGASRVHSFDTEQQLTQAFQSAGLNIQRSHSILEVQQFSSVRTMFDAIRKLGASNAQSETPRMTKTIYRSINNHFENALDTDGVLELTFETIFIHAKAD